MDATELARWTRFASRGGIGKCTAVTDCVAEEPGDLMFLTDDEITVLMQLPDQEGVYLGYCEGVVGRFQAVDVHFHSKLKKPVFAKRSSLHSLASSPAPSSTSASPVDANFPQNRASSRASFKGTGSKRVSSSSRSRTASGSTDDEGMRERERFSMTAGMSIPMPVVTTMTFSSPAPPPHSELPPMPDAGGSHSHRSSIKTSPPSRHRDASGLATSHSVPPDPFLVRPPTPPSPIPAPLIPLDHQSSDSSFPIPLHVELDSQSIRVPVSVHTPSVSVSVAPSSPVTITPTPPSPTSTSAPAPAVTPGAVSLTEIQARLSPNLSIRSGSSSISDASILSSATVMATHISFNSLHPNSASNLRLSRASVNSTSSLYGGPGDDDDDDGGPNARMSRISLALSDGETGIGLSLLQDLMGGGVGSDSDLDDDSDDARGLSYGDSGEDEDETISQEGTMADSLHRASVQSIAIVRTDDVPAPSASPTLGSAGSVLSSPSLPPLPPHEAPTGNETHERRPSLAPSTHSEHSTYSLSSAQSSSQSIRSRIPGQSEDWEGASDIYDDYRYSRYSVLSKASRFSTMSGVSNGMGVGAGVPPVPDARPSFESVMSSLSGVGQATDQRERKGSNESQFSTLSSQSVGFSRMGGAPSTSSPLAKASFTNATDDQEENGLEDGDPACQTAPLHITKRLGPPSPLLPSSPPLPPLAADNKSPLLHTTFGSPVGSPIGSPISPPPGSSSTSFFPNAASQGGINGITSALRSRLQGSPSLSPGDGVGMSLVNGGPSVEVVNYDEEETAKDTGESGIVVPDDEALPENISQEADSDEEEQAVDIDKRSMKTASVEQVDDSKFIGLAPAKPSQLINLAQLELAPHPPPPSPPPTSPLPAPPASNLLSPSPPLPYSQPIPRLRPTLANTAGAPHLQERRSLFMPHPGAPRAPNIPRPVDAARQPPTPNEQQPHFHSQPPPPPASPRPPNTYSNLPPWQVSREPVVFVGGVPAGSSVHAARLAMSTPPTGPRGNTIYGKVEWDLASALGPVLIKFSLEPRRAKERPPVAPMVYGVQGQQQYEQARSPPLPSSTPQPVSGTPVSTSTMSIASPPPTFNQLSSSPSNIISLVNPKLGGDLSLPVPLIHSASPQDRLSPASPLQPLAGQIQQEHRRSPAPSIGSLAQENTGPGATMSPPPRGSIMTPPPPTPQSTTQLPSPPLPNPYSPPQHQSLSSPFIPPASPTPSPSNPNLLLHPPNAINPDGGRRASPAPSVSSIQSLPANGNGRPGFLTGLFRPASVDQRAVSGGAPGSVGPDGARLMARGSVGGVAGPASSGPGADSVGRAPPPGTPGALQRPNFVPRAGTLRPRSRSFSGFSGSPGAGAGGPGGARAAGKSPLGPKSAGKRGSTEGGDPTRQEDKHQSVGIRGGLKQSLSSNLNEPAPPTTSPSGQREVRRSRSALGSKPNSPTTSTISSTSPPSTSPLSLFSSSTSLASSSTSTSSSLTPLSTSTSSTDPLRPPLSQSTSPMSTLTKSSPLRMTHTAPTLNANTAQTPPPAPSGLGHGRAVGLNIAIKRSSSTGDSANEPKSPTSISMKSPSVHGFSVNPMQSLRQFGSKMGLRSGHRASASGEHTSGSPVGTTISGPILTGGTNPQVQRFLPPNKRSEFGALGGMEMGNLESGLNVLNSGLGALGLNGKGMEFRDLKELKEFTGAAAVTLMSAPASTSTFPIRQERQASTSMANGVPRASLSSSAPSKPSVTLSREGEIPSPGFDPTATYSTLSSSPNSSSYQNHQHQPSPSISASQRTRPSVDTDTLSVTSRGSQMSSPDSGIPVGRQNSLRSKFSLPNLQRHRNRQDEVFSANLITTLPISNAPLSAGATFGDRNELVTTGETMQFQDMDFELVRPNVGRFAEDSRSSEDSGVLGRGSIDIRVIGQKVAAGEEEYSPNLLRAESPSGSTLSSTGGQRSPTMASNSQWSPSSPNNATTVGGNHLNSAHLSPHLHPHPPWVVRATVAEAESAEAHRQREQKWMTLISSTPPSQARKSKKVRKLLGEGVPSSVRYPVWSYLADGKNRCVPGVYQQLLGSKEKREKVSALKEIERDVSEDVGLGMPAMGIKKEGREQVVCLLQAYLSMVPDVQYSSGITLIASHLLMTAPEEDAFWIFVQMMDTFLRPYFSPSSTQLDVDASLFAKALEASDAAVANKILNDLNVQPMHICRRWFSELFAATLPVSYVNRIWDIFLFEGIPFLIRSGLAIITCCRRQILDCTSEETLLTMLNRPSPTWLPSTTEGFITLAASFRVKDDDIRKQRLKMEASVKKHLIGPSHLSHGMAGDGNNGGVTYLNTNAISLPRI